MAVVPAMVPHSLCNDGEELMWVVGFFSSSMVDSVSDRPMIEADEVLPTGDAGT